MEMLSEEVHGNPGHNAIINAIATAVPSYDIHGEFLAWASNQIGEERSRSIFDRMMRRSGIDHRYSVVAPGTGSDPNASALAVGGFFSAEAIPTTAQRMEIYSKEAPALALKAVAALGDQFSPGEITHLVLASGTGFVAPGVDQIVAKQLGLSLSVERLLVGFMGCYAGITALKAARNIVRSDQSARILVIAVELCSLHLQDAHDLETLIPMGLFADGAAAAIVSSEGPGLAMERPFSVAIEDSEECIQWNIGDTGFRMNLAPDVAARISSALQAPDVSKTITDGDPDSIKVWALHPGGRAILDGVQTAFAIDDAKIVASRNVLRTYGNMCSVTVMFVLAEVMAQRPKNGVAIAFGPGLAAEGFHIGWTDL
jgi:alpha-pyrone synthase